jgi:hypothetical protein
MKKPAKKALSLSTTTVRTLDQYRLEQVGGAATIISRAAMSVCTRQTIVNCTDHSGGVSC